MGRTFRQYVLLDEADYHNLKIKFDNTIARVASTAAYFDEAEQIVRKHEDEEIKQEEWDMYLACDPLPKPFEPEAIRKYYYQTMHIEKENVLERMNRLLGVDERSILSQDMFAENRTRKHIKENRPDFGKSYEKWISDAMEILRRIRKFLAKPTHELTRRVLDDVEEMQYITFEQIRHYIDNLTYKILSSEDAYMDDINARSVEYNYGGELFNIHLWAFKNVPLYLNPAVTPFHLVSLYKLKVELILPFSVLHENMVLRGLHYHFDHYSDHVRFYELPAMKKIETSLKETLLNDWQTQVEIQKDVRTYMQTQREIYEECLRARAEEEAIKAKKRKEAEEKSDAPPKHRNNDTKAKRPLRVPQVITPSVYPFVLDDFLALENQKHLEYIEKIDPIIFGLSDGEVNLRKYQILGGVYQFNFLVKPRSTNFTSLIMTWYKSDKTTNIQKLDSHLERGGPQDVSKFFKITFELPEYFCYWGEPIPCLYEEGVSHVCKIPPTTDIQSRLAVISPVIINDFNFHDLFDRSRMYNFLKTALPRILSSFQLPNDVSGEDDTKKTRVISHYSPRVSEQERLKALERQKHLLSFGSQKNPERLFPIFKKVLPIIIMPIDYENKSNGPVDQPNASPYEYFSDFFKALDEIKDKYRATTFHDDMGNPVKICTEDYDQTIRRRTTGIINNLDSLKRGTKKSVANTLASQVWLRSNSTVASAKSQPNVRKLSTSPKAKRKSSKTVNASKSLPTIETDPNSTKWSKTNILKSEFDPAGRKITIWTDRLGTFGLAYYRYQHFPFHNWSIQPNEANPGEVVLLVQSIYAAFRFYVSSKGYRLAVTDFTQYEKARKVYLAINEPTTDLQLIKTKMQQLFLNIFPEPDFSFYTTGYFSEKHIPAEFHTYKCMTLYSTSLKFLSSVWNKFSERRIMVIRFGEIRDADKHLFQIRVTPEDALFVDIKESCEDLDKTILLYTPTWRNLEPYSDLNHLIHATFNGADDMRLKDPYIMFYLNKLLQAIRPLSCS